jgi:chromate transporter
MQNWSISDAGFPSDVFYALNYCMLLPGPEATQLAVYIGWLMHRTIGGLMAGILFILPSLFILIGLSWAYMVFGKHHIVSGVLYGIKPAIVAIVLAAAWRIGSRSLRTHFLKGIAACAFIAITVLKLPFPAIVLLAALQEPYSDNIVSYHRHTQRQTAGKEPIRAR